MVNGTIEVKGNRGRRRHAASDTEAEVQIATIPSNATARRKNDVRVKLAMSSALVVCLWLVKELKLCLL